MMEEAVRQMFTLGGKKVGICGLTKEEREELQKAKWLEDFGDYNTMPQPYQEIDEDSFWYYWETSNKRGCEFRQVANVDKHYYLRNIYIFWCEDSGIAVMPPQDWTTDETRFARIRYKDKPRFFRIGCKHEWVELKPEEAAKQGIHHLGRNYHVEMCKKCGMIREYDSSD